MSESARQEAIAASRKAEKVRGEGGEQPRNICNDYVPRTYTLDEMADAKKELEETGVVVFRDVIDEDLQARYADALWSWLHRRSGGKILCDDPWENSKWPNSSLMGIQVDKRLYHLSMAREKAAPFFRGIYSTDDLLVSFDGANVMRPTKSPMGSADYLTPRHWLHVDSDGSVPPELSGYQGVVSISGMDGTNRRGGCFQAVLASHTDDFQNFFRDMWLDSSLPLSGTIEYFLVPYGHERVIAPDRSLLEEQDLPLQFSQLFGQVSLCAVCQLLPQRQGYKRDTP